MVVDKTSWRVEPTGKKELEHKAYLGIYQVWLFNNGLLSPTSELYKEIAIAVKKEDISSVLNAFSSELNKVDFVDLGYEFTKEYYLSSSFHADCEEYVAVASIASKFWWAQLQIEKILNQKYTAWKASGTWESKECRMEEMNEVAEPEFVLNPMTVFGQKNNIGLI